MDAGIKGTKMKIIFTPQRRNDILTLSKSGDVLTINGEDFDFSIVGEGDILPRDAVSCEFLASDITRTDGTLELTLILPHGPNSSEAARFPSPVINPIDGDIEVPQ